MVNSYKCGGEGGCFGATSELAFNYAQIFGITSESNYSFNPELNTTCEFKPKAQPISVTIDGYVKLPENSYKHLMKAVATIGPIVVSVDATQFADY